MKVIRFALLAVPLFVAPFALAITGPTAADIGGANNAFITISDKNFKTVNTVTQPVGSQVWFNNWYTDHEDNETEAIPTTAKGQSWDLEGMYMKDHTLTMVGGFDFKNGYSGVAGGDIFVDIDGNAVYGGTSNNTANLGHTVTNSYGYDYVIHFTSATQTSYTYSVYQINGTSMVNQVTDVSLSNPWTYASGGQLMAYYKNKSVTGYGTLDSSTVADLKTYGSVSTGLQGYTLNGVPNNTHYYLQVDTSFLPSNTLATFHYTMQCGNDTLMGQTRTALPDAGSTALMAGLGTLALVGLRRRKAAKS